MGLLDHTYREGTGGMTGDDEPQTTHDFLSHSHLSPNGTGLVMSALLGADGSSNTQAATESSSRPPSPPSSGTTTPTLRIPPCPPRLKSLIPPPNYGTVNYAAIYRGSFPTDRNIEFLKGLHIRHVLKLVTTEHNAGYQRWISEDHVQHTVVDIAANKDGRIKTTLDSLCHALLLMLDSSHYPMLIHCNQGRHRTGCVVACLRRVQRWPLDEILAEYHAYAWPKARAADVELITNFDPETVFHYAKRHGYFDGPTSDESAPSSLDGANNSDHHHRLRLRRLDSAIVNVDMLAEALQAGALIDSCPSDASESGGPVSPPTSSVASDGPLEMASFTLCREHAWRQRQFEQQQQQNEPQQSEPQMHSTGQDAAGSTSYLDALPSRSRAYRPTAVASAMDVCVTELDDDLMSP